MLVAGLICGSEPVSGSLVEEVQRIVMPVYASTHDALRLEVLQGLVPVGVGRVAAVPLGSMMILVFRSPLGFAVWAAQRLASAHGATGGQGHLAVGAAFGESRRRGLGGMELLAAIADGVVVGIAELAVVRLALATGGAEEALLALAAAADAGRVVGVVDAAEVAADLAAPARDAGLVDALVLGRLAAGRRGPEAVSGPSSIGRAGRRDGTAVLGLGHGRCAGEEGGPRRAAQARLLDGGDVVMLGASGRKWPGSGGRTPWSIFGLRRLGKVEGGKKWQRGMVK